MRKILYIITKSNWGGAQRYVYDLATSLAAPVPGQALPKDQFEAVVALGGSGPLKDKLEAAGVRTISIGSLQRDVSLLKEFKALRELVRIFKNEKPDVVHLNSSKAGGIGALAARLAGVPNIIFTVHGWPFLEERSFVWRAATCFMSWITVLLSHTTIVISNYDLSVAWYMPLCSRKVVRIYNGIDQHMQFGAGEKIRSAFPAGAYITGTIGELNKNKNQQALIEEAKNNPDMYVAIVGEGEERANLEAKIKEYGLTEQVKLFGFIPASEALKGFDTFALPSLKEGLPYVLLEARSADLPIVANRVGGVGEILDAKDISEFLLERMVAKTMELYKS